ncbi:MAG: hypothetical protein IJA31_11600 [Clostridia bacterium]|nr:hypothetical protein [Clostridia bacterium]MBQ3519952.1 hypothetical protein [Clostridia bacterium]
MAEITLTEIEHRLNAAEENIKELFGKFNGIDKNLVATTTTLNNLLTLVGELKAAIETLKARPSAWWDKLIFALIGAAASGIISYFVK